MPGELAGQDDFALAPADAPANEALDIEKIRQEAAAAATAAVEERIKGFQRIIAQRETETRALQRQLEEAQLNALDEDEREAELERRSSSELERLRAENELLRLLPEYPDELPLFQRLLAAPDAKTQLEFLRELRAPKAPAKEPESQAHEPAPVDPNNPASGIPGGGVFIEGAPMTDDLAERLLRGVSRLR